MSSLNLEMTFQYKHFNIVYEMSSPTRRVEEMGSDSESSFSVVVQQPQEKPKSTRGRPSGAKNKSPSAGGRSHLSYEVVKTSALVERLQVTRTEKGSPAELVEDLSLLLKEGNPNAPISLVKISKLIDD